MARTKDVDNKKKRTKTVLLSKAAFLRFKAIKNINPDWNFTDFVNRKILQAFREDGDEAIIRAQRMELEEERNRIEAEFQQRIQELVQLEVKLRRKRENQELSNQVDSVI